MPVVVIIFAFISVISVSAHIDKNVTKITVSNTRQIYQGEEIVPRDFNVIAEYSDGTSERVYDYDIIGYSTTTAETQNLTFKYGSVSCVHELKLQKCNLNIPINENVELNAMTGSVGNVLWYTENDSPFSIISKRTIYTMNQSYAGYIQYVTVSGLRSGVGTLKCKDTISDLVIAIDKVAVYRKVDNYKFDKTQVYLPVGETLVLNEEMSPYYDDMRKTIYSTDDTVASITKDGAVKANAIGSTEIISSLWDGRNQAKCKVYVVEPTSSIEVEESSFSFTKRGETKKVNFNVLPSNATIKNVVFTSSDTSVATINNNGEITAVGNGSAYIVIKSVDGFSECKIPVSVSGLVMGINVPKKTIDLTNVGQEYDLNVSVIPNNAINKKLSFKSADTNIVTIASSGKIKAKAIGETDITVVADDGGFEEKIHVIVHPETIIRYVRPYDVKSNCWSGETVHQEKVKWGDTFEIKPLKKDGYTYKGIYNDFHGNNYVGRIKDGSTIVAKYEEYEYYVQFDPIKPTKITLGIWNHSPYYSYSDNLTYLELKVTPKITAETDIALTVDNPSIACFNNNASKYTTQSDYISDNNGIENITLKLKKVGTVKVTATVSGTTLSPVSITLNISKTKDGKFVVEKNYLPSFKAICSCPNQVEFTLPYDNNLDRYIIYREDSKGKITELCHETANFFEGKSHLCYDYNLKPGQTYQYYARAFYTDGTCSKQMYAKVKMDYKPKLTVSSAGYKSIKVSVEEPRPFPNNGICNIYRSTDQKNWELVFSNYSYSFTDKNLKTGKKYYYKAVINYEGKNTPYSEIKSCAPKLSKPSLKTSKSTVDSITIEWKKIAGASKYNLYISTDGKNWSKAYVTDKTSMTFKGLKSGTIYKFKAVAIDKSGKNKSSTGSVLTTATKCKAPSITVKSTAAKTVTISWKKVDGATGYTIYYSTKKDGDYKKLGTTTGTSYKNKTLTSGKTYYFKVIANKKVSDKLTINSAYSNIKSIKIK